MEHGVDARIAGDGDAPRVDAFGQQVAFCSLGGREVQGGEAGGDHTVHFLGKRLRKIASAQTGFHMADGHVLVECRQRACQGRGRIALDDHHVRLPGFNDRLERRYDARGDLRKGLAGLHQVEVVIGRDGERGEHLIKHGAMLRGDTDAHLEPLTLTEVQQYGAELDGLGAGAEYEEDLVHDARIPRIKRISSARISRTTAPVMVKINVAGPSATELRLAFRA